MCARVCDRGQKKEKAGSEYDKHVHKPGTEKLRLVFVCIFTCVWVCVFTRACVCVSCKSGGKFLF